MRATNLPCGVRDYTTQTPEPIINTYPGSLAVAFNGMPSLEVNERPAVIHSHIEGTGYASKRHCGAKLFYQADGCVFRRPCFWKMRMKGLRGRPATRRFA